MKIRQLHVIDLARFCPLPRDMKRDALRRHRESGPLFTYNPLRSVLYDIFNSEMGMFAPVKPTPSDYIEFLVRRRSKSDEEFESNNELAKLLYQFTQTGGLKSKSYEFRLSARRVMVRVEYWLKLILLIDGSPLVPFIDPRRSRGLTSNGRRFAFSMMHEHVRVADPDLTSVRLGIFQFPKTATGTRKLILHTDVGVPLYSMDELDQMINETYAVWVEVLEEREIESRKKSGGLRGPLL